MGCNMVGAIGPHNEIIVPVDAISIKRADEGPVTVLSILAVRTSLRDGNDDGGRSMAFGILVAKDRGVISGRLYGCADKHLKGNGSALFIAQSEQHAVQRIDRDLGSGSVHAGGNSLVHRPSVHCTHDDRVVGRHILVEGEIEGSWRISHYHFLLALLIAVQYGSCDVAVIDGGELLFRDTGCGQKEKRSCRYDR